MAKSLNAILCENQARKVNSQGKEVEEGARGSSSNSSLFQIL